MAPRKKTELAPPSGLTATASTTYTSSYMVVQEPSPPFSSPPPSLSQSSSSQKIHKSLDSMAPSRSGISRLGTKRGHTVKRTELDRVTSQSQETAWQDELESTSPETPLSLEERNMRANASRNAPLTQKASPQQTTNLNNTLIKNKSLLYSCMIEDKREENEDCKTIMRKISVRVNDPRFQTWRQVKSWVMKGYRKYQRDRKSHQTASLTRKTRNPPCSIKTVFEKHIAPIINVAEMNINAKTFLNSVVETLGTRKLFRAFQHRIKGNKLPEDMGPLIFSPLYLKLCTRQIRKVTAMRNGNRYGTEDSDDNEWSDWEEEDGEMLLDANLNGGLNVLPSIEEDGSNIGESGPIGIPITRQRNNRLSTPSKTPGQDIREAHTRMNSQARRKGRRDGRSKVRNDRKRRSRHRSSVYTQNTIDRPAHRPVPDRNQSHDQMAETRRARNATAGLSLPPAVCIRPFADLMSPAATVVPDPDIESLFCDIGGRLDADSVSKGTGNSQDSINPTQKKRKRPQKQTEREYPGKSPSIPNTRDDTQHIYQQKGGSANVPSSNRRTPAILVAENERLNRKLAKPLATQQIPSRVPRARKPSPIVKTRRAHREIRPQVFYNRSAGASAVVSRGKPGLQARNALQYSSSSDNIRDATGGRPNREDRENKSKRNNAVVLKSIPRQLMSSHPSYLSDDDDDISFPPVEEIYERLVRKGLPLPRTAMSRTAATTTATTTATQMKTQPQTAGRKGDNKKRQRRGPSSGLGSPSKRMKPAAETHHDNHKSAVYVNSQGGNTKCRGRENSVFDSDRYTPSHRARAGKADLNDQHHARGESVPSPPRPNTSVATSSKRKRARSQKPSWKISS
ncbi:hypothetical protein F5Y09DRAFT_308616 [Xylaria sp. FL1042]|nr:hypothetical protein F5Y09DRAFT_308616 [Xylaria sp. FL1042]